MPSGWTRQQCAGVDLTQHAEAKAWTWLSATHPALAVHMARFERALRARGDKGEFWWELRPCAYYGVLEAPKIVYPDIAKSPRFHLDELGCFISNTAWCIGNGDPYLLAVLNSRLAWFLISSISIPFGTRAGQYRYRLFYQYMEQLPIFWPEAWSESQTAVRGSLVVLANEMQRLESSLAAADSPHERLLIQRERDSASRRIDRLVYDLYGLTDDEIALVESSFEGA